MSLASRVSELAQRIANEFRAVRAEEASRFYAARIGPLSVSAGATRAFSFTFPEGRFSQTPIVLATAAASDGVASTDITAWLSSWSVSGCTVTVRNSGTSGHLGYVTVIAMRP